MVGAGGSDSRPNGPESDAHPVPKPERTLRETMLAGQTTYRYGGRNSGQFPLERPLKTLPLSEAETKLGSLIDEIRDRDEEVTITKNGRPVAVLISSDEFERWKETFAIRADAALSKEIGEGLAALKERNAKLYTLEELFE